MPICEADPWRQQYFVDVPCPLDVWIPTDDPDAWRWCPNERHVYDKLSVALSQNLIAAPHGVAPSSYPVFSKPIYNLRGMGIGGYALRSESDYQAHFSPGHFWMPLLEGEHVSTDVAVVQGKAKWWRHTIGVALDKGCFDYWAVLAERRPSLESYVQDWMADQVRNYTGMMNVETIGGTIIECHLRFSDQWPDLNGPGWIEAVVELYRDGTWRFDDSQRADGFSYVLFGRHGEQYRHPPVDVVESIRSTRGVSSVQITFDPDRTSVSHAMPPGGFRLAIVNATDKRVAEAARRTLADQFPSGSVLLQKCR